MREQTNRAVLLAGFAALAGCVVGYFVADDSSTIHQLRTEITGLQSELDQVRRPESAASKQRIRSPSGSQVPQTTTNPPGPGAPQPMSPEWQAQMQAEAKKRSNERGVARTAEERSAEYTRVFSELRPVSTRC
jgi:outer membrane murein-binding lipoprotein Lpp